MMTRFSALAAMIAVAALLSGCGSGTPAAKTTSPTSTPNSYLGTQSPGDAWSWTITRDASGTGTFSGTNNTSGKQYSGTVATLSNKFLQLKITSSSDASVVGTTAPAVEFPTTALVVQPAGANDSPMIAAAQGTCPTQGSSYNWIKIPNLTWDPTVDAAFGTATTSGTGDSFDFSIASYLLGGSTPFNTVDDTGFACSSGEISSSDTTMPLFGATPSGMLVGDQGTNGGVIGMLQPQADIGSAAILQQGREFRGYVFMTHPPMGPDGVTPVDKTEAVWAHTLGDNLITAGRYTDFTNGVEDVCPGGDSCATFSLGTEVAPGEFAGTMTDSHAGSHPFTLMINQISGKYMIFGFSYNDAPSRPLLFMVMEQ